MPLPHARSWAALILPLRLNESVLLPINRTSRLALALRRVRLAKPYRRYSSRVEHCLITGALRGVRVTRIR